MIPLSVDNRFSIHRQPPNHDQALVFLASMFAIFGLNEFIEFSYHFHLEYFYVYLRNCERCLSIPNFLCENSKQRSAVKIPMNGSGPLNFESIIKVPQKNLEWLK